MRGDLLFYSPRHAGLDGFIERAICRFTNGPFCHVAIDLGDGTKVEARRSGIVRVPCDGQESARYHLQNPIRLEVAIMWLLIQVGERYGFEDIFNQVLKFCGFRFYIGEPKHYDCSDLAARFCRITNGLDLGPFEEDPHLITPNDLARCAGLIK